MYNPIELPSLDEIAEIEQARTKAIESLEMSDDGTLVKCQGKCGSLYPLIHKSNLTSDRDKINQLCRRIEYMKNHLPASYHLECKREEQELEKLLEEQKKSDILRRIPLYSSKITAYRFLCSKCYDEVYYSIYIKKK